MRLDIRGNLGQAGKYLLLFGRQRTERAMNDPDLVVNYVPVGRLCAASDRWGHPGKGIWRMTASVGVPSAAITAIKA